MTQNFRRRITLQTNPFYEIQKLSKKKYKEIDFLEKADSDTFIKSTVNKVTPAKEKKINPLLLETPKIEQEKQRRISIYSPLSFNQKSDVKNNNNEITNFTKEVYADIDKDIFPNFDFFPLKKVKKTFESKESNKKTYKEIEFYDERNKKYEFGLFKDKNILEKDFSNDKEGLFFNNCINSEESTDEEKKKNDCKRCINILKEGIELYSNNPGCISRNINNNN